MNNTSPALREHSYFRALENSGYLAKSGLSIFSTSDLVPDKYKYWASRGLNSTTRFFSCHLY